jgi:hypothetical protein
MLATNIKKISKESIPKRIPKDCILEQGKSCNNCCECFTCSLEPGKICDGCGKCLVLNGEEPIGKKQT